ncbi:MAG TPA: MFS transporter, partial [Dehalococcoidia bacterium]|nr:MFS transporter [Dehalococcoidia bacterium]
MTRLTMPFWLDPKLWAISVAETLAWAGMFYMFPALLLRWHRHFGWSISQLSSALMLALVISAVVGILSGRLIDKGFGRPLVTLSVITGGLILLFLLFVQELWQFYLVWGLVGIFMGACFYDPCFALLTRKYAGNAKGPIVMVTFFAGLAITVGFPISSIVSSAFGWKASVFTFSSFLTLISGPLFWYGYSDEIYSARKSVHRAKISSSRIVADLLRNPIFWGLSVMFTAFGINHIMLLSQILPILDSKGFSEKSA